MSSNQSEAAYAMKGPIDPFLRKIAAIVTGILNLFLSGIMLNSNKVKAISRRE